MTKAFIVIRCLLNDLFRSKLPLGYDLPICLNDRVNSPFSEGFILYHN